MHMYAYIYVYIHAYIYVHNQDLFVPVLPFLKHRPGLHTIDSSDSAPGGVLSQEDFDAFRAEHRRTLDVKLQSLISTFPSGAEAAKHLISAADATTRVLVMQMKAIAVSHKYAMGYIEHLLYSQLEAAVGKVVTAEDFNAFIKYHNKRLFLSTYGPQPFATLFAARATTLRVWWRLSKQTPRRLGDTSLCRP